MVGQYRLIFSSYLSIPQIHVINSLRPSDSIWQQGSGSTLAQVMACCLTAPSHYLNQCWLIISKVLWHSSEGNFVRDTSATIHTWFTKIGLKITNLNSTLNLPGANELKIYLIQWPYGQVAAAEVQVMVLVCNVVIFFSKWALSRDHFVNTPSQWETMLHWLGAFTKLCLTEPLISLIICDLVTPCSEIDLGLQSTLAQAMACCLTAPSHFLNHCWPLIDVVLCNSLDCNITGSAQVTILYNDFKDPYSNFHVYTCIM